MKVQNTFLNGYLSSLFEDYSYTEEDDGEPIARKKLFGESIHIENILKSMGSKIYGPYKGKKTEDDEEEKYLISEFRGEALDRLVGILDYSLQPSKGHSKYKKWRRKHYDSMPPEVSPLI
jgi:hypothetical protein